MRFRTKRKKRCIIACIAVVILGGMQFVPVQCNKSSSTSSSDFMNVYQVPDAIQNKLRVACYDCHSNNTRYSWYNNIQPVAWLLERHVSLGKAELDFSVWKDYSVRRKRTKLKSIISQIDEGAMPLSTYTLLHRDAVFSKEEKELVLEWLQQLRDSL